MNDDIELWNETVFSRIIIQEILLNMPDSSLVRLPSHDVTCFCASWRQHLILSELTACYWQIKVISCKKGLRWRLVSSYQLNAHFLHSITIYMLHYNPQRVSSSTLLIFRRTNCIITASGIVTLFKRPYSKPVESGLSALNRHTVLPFTIRSMLIFFFDIRGIVRKEFVPPG